MVDTRPTLVTGGAGFIGSALVRRWAEAGRAVVVVDALTYAGSLDALDGALDQPHIWFEHVDIRDRDALGAVFRNHRPSRVVHLAAESHVDRSIDGPSDFVTTNVVGTFTLLEAARAHWLELEDRERDAFRFLHVSTDEVFGELGATGAFTEATPYAPSSPYSATKAASDHLVRAWHRTYGLPTLVTNCSNNYGPYQHPEKLIPVVIRAAAAGQPIPVYGAGDNVRDWLHVADHVRGLEAALMQGAPGETYALGGGAERTTLEVVRTICSVLDQLRPQSAPHARLISFVSDRPGHDFRYAIDASKAERELGWAPERSFEQGVEETVAWYLAHSEWTDSRVNV